MIIKEILLTCITLCTVTVFSQEPILWKAKTNGEIHSSPAIHNNKLFVGSGDNHLYAFNKNTGQELWKFQTGNKILSSPCIEDNKVYTYSTDGNVYALDNNNGKLLWQFKTKGERRQDPWDYYTSSPIVNNGVLYVGSGDSTVYAINTSNGTAKWAFKTNGIVHASPILQDNIIYIGSYDGCMYALDAVNGELKWKFKTQGNQYFPKGEVQRAAVIHDNTIYFGSRDYYLYALDIKTGKSKWSIQEKDSWIVATPLVYDGKLYFGTSDSHKFYCIDEHSGKVIWSMPLNMRVYGTANVVNDKIVFGCFNGKLYFVNSSTGKVEEEFQLEENKKNYCSIYKKDGTFKSTFTLYGDDYLEAEKKILALGSILSDPLIDVDTIYFGDTNGNIVAVKVKN